MQKTPSIGELLRRAKDKLTRAYITNPMLEASLLIEAVSGYSRAKQITNSHITLTEEQIKLFYEYLQQRLEGRPLAYILGYREFYSRNFKLSPEALIPRADSETLIEAAKEELQTKAREDLKILELGVGNGCLIITLLKEFTGARGVGVDLSSGSLNLAAENSKLHNVSDRLELQQSDWYGNLACKEKFNLIITNPPYINANDYASLPKEVRDYEPKEALLAGPDGLDAYRKIACGVENYLQNNGIFICEIGAGQKDSVEAIFHNNSSLKLSSEKSDLAGFSRALVFARP